jgi:hypothetical protein
MNADHRADSAPCTWDPALDAVIAAPKHHKVLFESKALRVLEVTLEPNDEEPVHHHRWPSVFVFDQVQGPVHDIAPDGTQLPPNRDAIKAIEAWNGQGCLVVHMAPQPAGRVLNASEKTIHGIRVEMKTTQ